VRVATLEVAERAPAAASGLGFACGDVSVIEKVVGFKKIKYQTHENVGYGEVNLPELQMHTSAFWLTVPEVVVQRQPVPRPLVIDAMHGIANALHTVASIGLMTDPCDIGHTLGDKTDDGSGVARAARSGMHPAAESGAPSHASDVALFDPTLFIYDRIPGGVGLAPRLFDARDELMRRARGLIETCDCREGCPACVGPVVLQLDTSELATSRKRIALGLLTQLGIASTH
jgi:DEAD/DEAH box helicase domain-containing protein